jgi:hypothetical protein
MSSETTNARTASQHAETAWRAVNAPHLVALVRSVATFINGRLVERPGENTEPEAAKNLNPQVLTIYSRCQQAG